MYNSKARYILYCLPLVVQVGQDPAAGPLRTLLPGGAAGAAGQGSGSLGHRAEVLVARWKLVGLKQLLFLKGVQSKSGKKAHGKAARLLWF